MFIDANVDPTSHNYREFIELLCPLAARHPKPLVEIHRVCYVGSGRDRQIIDAAGWKQRFGGTFHARLAALGLRAEVFIWDDLHDRYLIADVVGLSLPYGFDISANPGATTTWTRLGREDRDRIQREFDPASGKHKLHEKFSIGAV